MTSSTEHRIGVCPDGEASGRKIHCTTRPFGACDFQEYSSTDPFVVLCGQEAAVLAFLEEQGAGE